MFRKIATCTADVYKRTNRMLSNFCTIRNADIAVDVLSLGVEIVRAHGPAETAALLVLAGVRAAVVVFGRSRPRSGQR